MQHIHCFRFVITLTMCTAVTFSLIWMDRRPRLTGDKIPFKSLMPNRKQIRRKIIIYHNYFRSNVIPEASDMLRMKWHRGAAKSAQRWAQKCQFLVHDNVNGRFVNDYGVCGQNIFVATRRVPWLFSIKTWYLEKDRFTYGSREVNLKEVGHYIQMVWASTHKIGCGFARCYRNTSDLNVNSTMKGVYYNYVCNYCPIGNRQNKTGYPYKRGRPCASCKNHCYKKRLCTNSCLTTNFWANCKEIYKVWPKWLCGSYTLQGRNRYHSCGATCSCDGKIYD